MFDDKTLKNPSNIPNNLPIGEPDDMFAGVDPVSNTPQNDNTDSGGKTLSEGTALGAGVLRPKNDLGSKENVSKDIPRNNNESNIGDRPLSSPQNVESNNQIPNLEQNSEFNQVNNQKQGDVYTVKEPAITRGIVTVFVIILLVLVLGFGGWWIYDSFINQDNKNQDIFQDNIVNVDNNLVDNEENNLDLNNQELDNADANSNNNNDLAADIVDEQILFGEPVDKDGDSLDDDRELDLGTDPNNWDTDGDGLGDGDEVIVWKTDPLNTDSDGDGYTDGDEVKNGYNPAGDGKIFEPPTEEEENISNKPTTTENINLE